MTRALRFSGVSHRHQGAQRDTLTAIDLTVEPSEMVAVLGPSGSGKSTLLRLAAGLLRPSSGHVMIDDADITHASPEDRDITLMFQKPHLFPHLSVLDNVAFPRIVDGVRRRAARETAARYLELVHLGALAGRMPRQLSGGQEQRVALARALATNRSVMLLDEPFSALDTDLRRSMHGLLREIRAALEPTVVMVTHDVTEAALADRVAVVVGGRVAQLSGPAELYTNPASLDVARLVGGFNALTPGLAARLIPGARSAVQVLVRSDQLCLCDDGRDANSVEGVVTSCGQSGPRPLIEVLVAGQGERGETRLNVELPVGGSARHGTSVRVRMAPGAKPVYVPGVSGGSEALVTPPAFPAISVRA